MVDFHRWLMPLHYGSQVAEHHAVRQKVGLFDVSHMTVTDIAGDCAKAFLENILANNIHRLKHTGRAMYTLMLNEQGGIIDDLIAYRLANGYRLVTNCGTRDRVRQWLAEQAAGSTEVILRARDDLAVLALQGPEYNRVMAQVMGTRTAQQIASLPRFDSLIDEDISIARTGYTGEDGVEIILESAAALRLWPRMLAAGATPAGLGCRDTLRLEAGFNLHGQDMDETTSPLESNLGWSVSWKPPGRNFVGRAILEEQKAKGAQRRLTGLILEDSGIVRAGYQVYADTSSAAPCGTVTSGSFSPTLKRAIALARVNHDAPEHLFVDIRGTRKSAYLFKPPFVVGGKSNLPPKPQDDNTAGDPASPAAGSP